MLHVEAPACSLPQCDPQKTTAQMLSSCWTKVSSVRGGEGGIKFAPMLLKGKTSHLGTLTYYHVASYS